MDFFKILKGDVGLGMSNFDRLFAEKHGGGAWQLTTLTGALPLSFKSNGTALIDYRIYGTTDEAGVQTENLFNYSTITTGKRIYWATGEPSVDNTAIMSDYIPVTEGDYTLNTGSIIIGYAADKSYIGVYASKEVWRKSGSGAIETFTVLNGINVKFVKLLTYGNYSPITNTLMLTKGSTPPETFIPYGYKLPLTVTNSIETKTTDVYIGDSKLGEEEYVDYEEQKVYKRTANISKGTETGSIWANSSSVPADMRGTDADANNRTRTKSEEYYQFSTTQSYTISTPGITGTQVSLYTYDPDDYTSLADSAWTNLPYTFIPSDYYYRFVIRYSNNRIINNANYPNLMITEGSTAPETYIPYLQPTDPPLPLPEISTYKGTNTLDSTETLGEVTIKGQIKSQS